jgi:hypothetical protein
MKYLMLSTRQATCPVGARPDYIYPKNAYDSCQIQKNCTIW